MTTNEISEISIDRELSRKRAENESKRADMKQHADKLIQGFEKLEDSHAKRAIWELCQNAIDLSEHSEIIIELNEHSITFKHNGKPFTSNTLSCLIKQVSSKNPNSNNDEVGQYGTGFISTHSFGKRILITGSLSEGDYFIPIKDFEIDRVANTADQLIDKLMVQQDKVFDLVGQGELKAECSPFTSFSYQTISKLEKTNASNAVENLNYILPYVMMINKKLRQVKVYQGNGKETIYRKGDTLPEGEVFVTTIHINDDIKKIFSLGTSDDDLVIILPLSGINQAIEFENNPSKLFLYYPLIGTEYFGFNFLIHSKQFAPTEPRDGIHLKSKNEQVQEKEESNRKIIESASKLIFEFVRKNAKTINNPKSLASICFNSNSGNAYQKEYFTGLKKDWVKEFKTFSLVETDTGRIEPAKASFFSRELLFDQEYFPAIYAITKLYRDNIPKEDLALDWTNIIEHWEDKDISYITISEIVKEIAKSATLNFFSTPEDLQKFYEYIIKYSDSGVFNQHKLLPNIKNEFRLKSQLNSTLNIEPALIKIADIIIPEIPKRYIKEGFELNLGFEPYDRKQFSKDINSQIAEYNKTIKENSTLAHDILFPLIDYCKIFPALDNTGTRGELVKLVCEYYKIDPAFVGLPTVTNQEMDWLMPIKCLLRDFIWVLNKGGKAWVEANVDFLSRLLSVIHSYYEFDDIVQTLPIFPNQDFELCKQGDLKVDAQIPDELKKMYNDVVQPKQPIQLALVLDGFSDYLKNGEAKYPKHLGDSIDKVLQDEAPYAEINKHPHSGLILSIIKKMSDDEAWIKYFPFIEEKKATIMMARISDKETKNDLFSIIGLEKEKVALLGDLSRQDDMEQIIQLGKNALLDKKQTDINFRFKHSIGKHIEDLIRDKIGGDLKDFEVLVRDEQNGQDIVVKLSDTVIRFIEVKSRWDVNSSITMSRPQMKNAYENPDRYSLCCVDMHDYKKGDDERYKVTDINEIINRINVLSDIGQRIEPVLKGVFAVKDINNEINLTGDYRGTVPQSIVKLGMDLNSFIDNLTTAVIQAKQQSGIVNA